MSPKNQTRTVILLLFDDVEVLDFAGPFEVFSVTAELGREFDDENPFEVITAAPDDGPITARNGLKVIPDRALAHCPAPDIILVPGGFGTRALSQREDVLEWLRRAAQGAERVLSVCTGSLVLATAGILKAGMEATTHHQVLGELEALLPEGATLCPGKRFTDNGRVLTAGGVAAGIDLALHVVAQLLGEDTAARTRAYMEYGEWSPIAANMS
jgi:transcriptional regulator GlxA family with amidase domain